MTTVRGARKDRETGMEARLCSCLTVGIWQQLCAFISSNEKISTGACPLHLEQDVAIAGGSKGVVEGVQFWFEKKLLFAVPTSRSIEGLIISSLLLPSVIGVVNEDGHEAKIW